MTKSLLLRLIQVKKRQPHCSKVFTDFPAALSKSESDGKIKLATTVNIRVNLSVLGNFLQTYRFLTTEVEIREI